MDNRKVWCLQSTPRSCVSENLTRIFCKITLAFTFFVWYHNKRALRKNAS